MIHPDASGIAAEAVRLALRQRSDLIALPPATGRRNAPQVALLLALLAGAEGVARTLADNAYEDGVAIPAIPTAVGHRLQAMARDVNRLVSAAMVPLAPSEAMIDAYNLPAGYRLPTHLDEAQNGKRI